MAYTPIAPNPYLEMQKLDRAGVFPRFQNQTAQPASATKAFASTIAAPTRVTAGQVSQAAPVSVNQLAGGTVNAQTAGAQSLTAPSQITALNDDYYTNLENQATKRLNEQYFSDPSSISNKASNAMKQRGLFGSGLDVQGQQEIFKSFGGQLADLQGTLANQRAQQTQDVSKFNIQSLLDANKFDIGNQLDLSKFNVGTGVDVGKFNVGTGLDVGKTNIATASDLGKFNTGLGVDINKTNVAAGNDMGKFNTTLATDVATKNATLGTDVSKVNAGLGTDVSKSNAQLYRDVFNDNIAQKLDISKLKIGSGLDAAKIAADYGSEIFGAQVEDIKSNRESINKNIAEINDMAANDLISPEQRSQMINQIFLPYMNKEFGVRTGKTQGMK